MTDAIPISVAYGDGIGPEVVDAALRVLRHAYANISVEVIEAGEALYHRGAAKGIYDQDLEGLQRTGLLLLGPVITPPGAIPLRETLRSRYQLSRTEALATPFADYAPAQGFYGPQLAIFESLQSADPESAGRDAANPSAMIHAAILLLLYTKDLYNAQRIHNAWLSTIEEGIHTQSMQNAATTAVVGTQAFVDALTERFGEEPRTVAPIRYNP